jgi:hypothetical protein
VVAEIQKRNGANKMNKLSFIAAISIFLCSQTVNGQSKLFEPINEIYTIWLNSNSEDSVKCELFFYSDSIDGFSIDQVITLLNTDSIFLQLPANETSAGADTIILSSAERKEIIKQLNQLNSIPWTDRLFNNSTVIQMNRIKALQQATKAYELTPAQKLCYTVYTFSRPVFFRDSTFCIFYSGKKSHLLSEGEFRIYKKEKSKWESYSLLFRREE